MQNDTGPSGTAHPPFIGAKVALFAGPRLITLLRDDKPGLPWPAMWDLPGGGREGAESPEACMIRETHEEVGLDLTGHPILWRGTFPAMTRPDEISWFFLLCMPAAAATQARLGDEGQRLALMTPDEYLSHPRAIGFLQDRLRIALAAAGAPLLPPGISG
jgi:8-oxo-dGTP diphosphatase